MLGLPVLSFVHFQSELKVPVCEAMQQLFRYSRREILHVPALFTQRECRKPIASKLFLTTNRQAFKRFANFLAFPLLRAEILVFKLITGGDGMVVEPWKLERGTTYTI